MLIPGAWQGAWSWLPVAKRLRAAGHRAITLTLPGLGDGDDPSGLVLKDAIGHVVNEVRRRDLDNVTLVAHSWGGYPATGAAHLLATRVSKVVYFNGLVPAVGGSVIDDDPDRRELTLRLIGESPVGAVTPALEFVERMLMQGVAPALQRMVAELMTPQPGRYFLDTLDVDVATLGVDTAYIASDRDHALPFPAAGFAARLGVAPEFVPGTHVSMLTHPDEVAKAILAT
ncbi:alpha/beta hydrolase [Mycobacterium conspicuum]|nr:alpha/beta hydrolase [Mycobacterium conspicuum]